MKKILVINEGFSNNFGDQAINQSIISFFKHKGFETSFLYLSNPSIKELPEYKYLSNNNVSRDKSLKDKIFTYILFFLWFFKFNKIIKQTLIHNKFDLIVIGGGQLIISSGNFALSSFSTAIFWYTYIIKRFAPNVKIHMIGVGVSNKFNLIEKFLYKKSLNRVEKVLVRDKFSQKKIYEHFNIKAKLMPDIAFYNSINLKIYSNIKKEKALIGITNYNEVYKRYNKKTNKTKIEYFEYFYTKIKKYEQLYNKIELFYTTITDAKEALEFQEYIYKTYNKQYSIANINNLNTLTNLFKEAKIVYSGRMHALILAMKEGCEVEAMLISDKLKSFNHDYIIPNKSMEELIKEIKKQLQE
jgi:polysaccharide pyruvyl transferase WcaK-like protein